MTELLTVTVGKADARVTVLTVTGELDRVIATVAPLGIAPPVMSAPPAEPGDAWAGTSDAAYRTPLFRDSDVYKWLEALGWEQAREPSADPQVSPLTARERQVTDLIAAGRTNRQIGRELGIAEKTVEVHVHHVITKLGAQSRTEVAAWVVRRS